jgi:hypothetical protein
MPRTRNICRFPPRLSVVRMRIVADGAAPRPRLGLRDRTNPSHGGLTAALRFLDEGNGSHSSRVMSAVDPSDRNAEQRRSPRFPTERSSRCPSSMSRTLACSQAASKSSRDCFAIWSGRRKNNVPPAKSRMTSACCRDSGLSQIAAHICVPLQPHRLQRRTAVRPRQPTSDSRFSTQEIGSCACFLFSLPHSQSRSPATAICSQGGRLLGVQRLLRLPYRRTRFI